MARNGSGLYAVPNAFTPNTSMSASAVNANFTDAGNELSNSVARDGQSSMSGPLKAFAGTAGEPGISWGTDTDTGFRLASSDEMRWVTGGTDRLYVDSAGKAWLLGAVDIAGTLNLQGALSGAGVADLAAIEALTGTGALVRTGTDTWDLDDGTTVLTYVRDGFGTVLTTGVLGELRVDFDCTITAGTLLADKSGSIVIDVWKDTFGNFPPTNDDSITSSAPLTISADTKSEDTTLTDWTVSISAGDTLIFNVDSITSITRIGIYLRVKRFA